MQSNFTNSFGDFTVFGFSHQPEPFLQDYLAQRLGISATRIIDFGHIGRFFFYTSYGEVEETDTKLVLKLGLARSRQMTPLSAKHLTEQGLISPQSINAEAIRGNALVACFSKNSPQFSVYKTLLSLPQLFYSTIDGELICTDTPRSHAALLKRVELCEEAIPQHFLFRYSLGRYSYYRDVHRLLPGELFRWNGGELRVSLERTLRSEPDDLVLSQVNADSVNALYQKMIEIMGVYISDAQASGRIVANLLSGGIDSSIIQLLINQKLSDSSSRKSFSYAPRLPNFEYEIQYAEDASNLFQTDHTFVDVLPEDFIELAYETNDALAQPVSSEAEPCLYAVGKHIAANEQEALRFFTIATGADTLFGLAIARKLNLIEKVKHIPGSSLMLRGFSKAFSPQSTKRHALRQIAGILPELNNPNSFKMPTNTIAIYTDLDVARRSFGDDLIRRTLEYRRSLETTYLDSPSFPEKVHMVDFLSDAYENAVINNLMFLTSRREQISPFLDEDFIRLSRAFPPEIRYLNGHEIKPVLKRILEMHTRSSITRKPKGYSVFNKELFDWMKDGFLRNLIDAIDRPAFVNQADIDMLLDQLECPDSAEAPRGWFLWNLLTFDIFQKRIVNNSN